ncbi:glycoside hydrolase family 28 protein [Zopfia rhizophila CBS 207.26]|uniref:Glycoside hydrolase family 28 protein n=1 Tax=Zopfia rhizophila CBS 207.26 TaxID=1314779 RepID=A0A6A6DTD6_9PEZI|nr:glycoside hydrolase family 28 protein [Zopfia rhizophila CBS 207.26]
MLKAALFVLALLSHSFASAQLSGRVGPLTTYAAKAAVKVCNVLDYGAKSDSSTDLGPPLATAWVACRGGGLVYIPAGNYAMSTWVSLRQGSGAAIQLDGTIIRASDTGGNMISIEDSDDFEFFSGTSKGAMQGYGYKLISQGTFGARFIRFTNVSNFSIHGIALVDSASYYLVFDTCTNGEIYNLILRGIQIGETDGIDIWGQNIWVHDVEVTNGDECVTIKSPSKYILVESVYCNISGGNAIGSLGTGTDISNVLYRRIYANQADPCYLKTNGGDGTVSDVTWDTVIVHKGPYVLAVNEAWGTDRGSIGVQVKNLYYKNWHGYNTVNSRPVIRLECDPDLPCYNITLNNVNLWTADGDYVTWSCQNAYGTGACLRSANNGLSTYTSVTTAGKTYYATSYMPSDLASAFPSTVSFTIPPVPTTFYPDAAPSSKLLSISGPGGLN